MMETNDVLLWTVQGNRLRAWPEIKQPRPKIQEFHLTVLEPHTAKPRLRCGYLIGRDC